MRTTVDIDDRLLARLRSFAARTGSTLRSVIEDALREKLARETGARPKRQLTLTTFKGNGVLPGIELDSNAALLDAMGESRDPA